MKQILLILFFLPLFSFGQNVPVEEMPDPMAKRFLNISRPNGEKLVKAISSRLNLTTEQEKEIIGEIKEETEDFDDLRLEYEKAGKEEEKWRRAVNEARRKMLKISMNIPGVLKYFLDEEQKEIFYAKAMHKSRRAIRRPDGEKLLLNVAAELRLSSMQQKRILKAMDEEADKFDDFFKEHGKAGEKERKWRYEMNEIRHKMLRLTMNLPEVLRECLDPRQRETFDTLVENSMAPKKKRTARKKRTKKTPAKSGRAAPKQLQKEKGDKEEPLWEGYYP